MNAFDNMLYDGMIWSFSRLDSFDQCPLMWRKIYLDCEQKKQNAFAQYGSLMHGIIERILKNEIDIFEAPLVYEKEFDEVITEEFPPMKNGDMRENYRKKGYDYLTNISTNDNINRILGIEEKIEFKISNKPFVGYIDLRYLDKDGRMVIQDHKSSAAKFKKNGDPAKSFADKMKHYEYQVYLYSKPFVDAGENVDLLRWNFFNTGIYYEIPWNKDDYNDAIRWAEEKLAQIKNEDEWSPRLDYYFCHHICDVSDNCEALNTEESVKYED